MTAWEPITDPGVADDAPGTDELCRKLAARDAHLFEFGMDPAARFGQVGTTGDAVRTVSTFAERVPHAHVGDAFGGVPYAVPMGQNLVLDAGGSSRTNSPWNGDAGRDEPEEVFELSPNQVLWQQLGWDWVNNEPNVQWWGEHGSPLMASFFARATGAVSGTNPKLAVTDGSEDPDSSSHVVEVTGLTTSWQRFFVHFDNANFGGTYPGGGYSTDVRLLLSCAGVTYTVRAVAFDVRQAGEKLLLPFAWSPADTHAQEYGRQYQNSAPKIPILNTELAMTNAVDIGP